MMLFYLTLISLAVLILGLLAVMSPNSGYIVWSMRPRSKALI